jgi:DNA-binding MarR family transcriptional regulator
MSTNSQRIEEVLEHCVNFNFRRIARKLAAKYDAAFHELDLKTTQYSLMAAIHAAGNPTLAQLADAMALDRTTLLRNLEPLEKRKLVVSGGASRGQKREVRLTPEGQELLAAAFRKWRTVHKQTIAGIGPENWKQLSRSLKEIANQI